MKLIIFFFLVSGAILFAQEQTSSELPEIKELENQALSERELNAFIDFEERKPLELIHILLDRLVEHIKVVDLDPIKRVGMHRIKINQQYFDRGTGNYVQGRVEEAFVRFADFDLITSPELNQITVISTDSSLQIYNNIPKIEMLWELGKELYLDAFLQGELGATPDGSYYLNVKVIKQQTGDILWSKNLLIGDNLNSEYISRWSLGIGVRFLGVETTPFTIDWEDQKFTELYLNLGYRNRFLETRTFWYTFRLGLAVFNSAVTNPTEPSPISHTFPAIKAAADFHFVLIPRTKSEGIIDGRGLLSVGSSLNITLSPVYYRGQLLAVSGFLLSHFSRVFSFRFALDYFIGSTTLVGESAALSTVNSQFIFEKVGVNAEILWDF